MSSPVSIVIDSDSGFCFGVTAAIDKAESELSRHGKLYCLGDIVHNSDEVERLCSKGLITITHDDMPRLHDAVVLLRAHGEPPSTYIAAEKSNIRIIDATCPVVLRLQRSIKQTYLRENPPQIVIYGQSGHAEVNGLVGQTDGTAIVVENSSQLDAIDYTRPVAIYSQTTKPLDGYRAICDEIKRRMLPGVEFTTNDTICRQVANRGERIKNFAASHTLILFVSGKKSSNGRVLFNLCRQANPRTHLVSNATEICPDWLTDITSVGICGATSTPRWLMEQVRDKVESLITISDKQ
ncbi:MAG: 4-hydroxy-3-methylbut-2-enyl diphosphate reductase [Paramuribaculum sp.]|nr:4-hydroxy-3-methylbut-2-enyl diphosphate reductase [Paramuribaculum sp.]